MKLIGSLLGGVARTVGTITAGPLLPWIALAVVAAIGALIASNALLRSDVARCAQAAAEHAADYERFTREAVEAQRARDHKHAADMAEVDRLNTLRRLEDEARIEQLDADVRAGRVRLRSHFSCPSIGGQANAPASAGRNDESALLRERAALDIVRVGQRCDRQVRGLQAAVRIGR